VGQLRGLATQYRIPRCPRGDHSSRFRVLGLARVVPECFALVGVSLSTGLDLGREKETLRPFLYTYTRRVVGDAMSIILPFKRATNEDIDSEAANTDYEGLWPSLEETRRMCAAVNPASQAPQFLGTWLQFLAFQKRRTEDECSRIYTATRFLEADHLQLLIDLENCSYFNHLTFLVALGAGDGDLSFMAKELHDYFERARRLHEYANRQLTLSGQWEPLPSR
jgi:hypothetical protein